MAGKVVGLRFEILCKLDSYFLMTIQYILCLEKENMFLNTNGFLPTQVFSTYLNGQEEPFFAAMNFLWKTFYADTFDFINFRYLEDALVVLSEVENEDSSVCPHSFYF